MACSDDLMESPGQEEALVGASTPEGLAEFRVIYVGLKCTRFTQGSRQSPGELTSEGQMQGAVPELKEPLSFALSTSLPAMRTHMDSCGCMD